MKILVTGAGKNSFLGHHLKTQFQDKNHEMIYVGSECDLTISKEANSLFYDIKPEIVVHAAAKCGGILANKNNPALFLRDNLLINVNTYDAAFAFGVKKIIALGTVCMYPVNCPVPFKEDNIFEGTPELTNFPYGESKRVLYLLGKTYKEQYGLNSMFLVPVNMYGTNDHFDLENSHVIPALIAKFVNAKRNNLPTVECWGTGTASREFLNAEDCARAIFMAVEQQLDSTLPINIGTGQEIVIKDLTEMIAKLTDYKGQIVFNGSVSDGQPRRQLDISRAKEMLGFEASINLEDGLRKTVDWYMENY